MKLQLPLLMCTFVFLFASCGSSKTDSTPAPQASKTHSSTQKANDIVSTAKGYLGTRYRAGGTTKKGMDCSGLVYTALSSNGISAYRTSYDMSKQGKAIKTNEVKKGDLLFFKTSKSGKSINHVGLVSKVKQGTVYFIHSSSSKGVIESTLTTNYWAKTYKFAKRIL